MDQQQPLITPTSLVPPSPPPGGAFRTGIPTTIAFAVSVLMFLLPFSEIRCNKTAIMYKSGVDFATNHDWRASKAMGGDMFKDDGNSKPANKEGSAPYLLLAALALGIIGIVVSVMKSPTSGLLSTVTGVGGAICLIGFMVMLKNWFDTESAKDAAKKAKDATDGLSIDKIRPTLDMTAFFYIAVVCFLAAAAFGFMRMKSQRKL